MRRVAVSSFIILVCVIVAGLCQSAIDPDNFAGEWYSAMDQSVYLFQDGLLYCTKHPVPLSDNTYISGAYTYSKNTIFLFAAGIEGLEKERELHLIHNDDGSFLCESEDGTGQIYFIRNRG